MTTDHLIRTPAVGAAWNYLADQGLRLDERVVLAWMLLDYDNPTRPEGGYTEQELANAVGLSRHQVRQALVGPRRDGRIQRGWLPLPDGGRPLPLYRVTPEVAEGSE